MNLSNLLQAMIDQACCTQSQHQLMDIQGHLEHAKPLDGGKNNTLYLLTTSTTPLILKQFGAHQTESSIQNTHRLLIHFAKLKPAFYIPHPIALCAQEPFTFEGKFFSFYTYREGTHPTFSSLSDFFNYGAFLGRLAMALSQIQMPALDNLDNRYGALNYLHLEHVNGAFADIVEYLQRKMPLLYELPIQLIHGDVNASNLLAAQNGEITGILDFEFAAYDIGALELAIALSPLESSAQRLAVIQGFSSIRPLSQRERAALPDLILLRKLDVALHFLVKEGASPLAKRCGEALERYWRATFPQQNRASSSSW